MGETWTIGSSFHKDRLLYSEKEESRQLFEDLQEYWGDDLPMEYDEATGKVKGLWVLDQYDTIQATPALANARKLASWTERKGL